MPFTAVNKKVKDLWQIKFAEDIFADKIDDHSFAQNGRKLFY